MKISRTVAYALQATMLLAESGSEHPVPCSRLSDAGKMPERFLLQILRNLVTHDILDSTRGVDGGYKLRRSASEISVLDVIEAIEGPVNPKLPEGNGLTDASRKIMTTKLTELAAASRDQLGSVKIADLLAS